jgi:hypothetical protein
MFTFSACIFIKQRNGIYTKDPEVEKKNVEVDSYMPCHALAHKLSLVIVELGSKLVSSVHGGKNR